MTEDLKTARASVVRLPEKSGDGYSYGGGTLVAIGSSALDLGEGRHAIALAQEIARRWNASASNAAIEAENAKLKKALRRAREWGLNSKNFHGGISFELGAWVDAGMGDPLPKLRDELDEEDVND